MSELPQNTSPVGQAPWWATRRGETFIMVLCALVLCLSVRSNSLWIDEGQTLAVISGSWRCMMRSILFRGDAVSGMPLYFLCEFWWCRLFGLSEYAMRSMNLVFGALIFIGCYNLLKINKLSIMFMTLFLANPVLLYYMNEARPYVALLACGVWFFVFLLRLEADGKTRHLAGLLVCLWIACALHLMAVFLGGAYLILLVWLDRDGRLRWREHLRGWLYGLPAFLVLAVHYLHFLFWAPEVNAEHPVPLASILQIGYFFAGFGGLGWSRNALRAKDFGVSPRMVAELCLGILSSLAVWTVFWRSKLYRGKRLLLIVACLAGTMCAFVTANLFMRTRFWERHVIYLLPGGLLVMAFCCERLLAGSHGRCMQVAAWVFLAMQVISGIQIVSLNYYQKDDYRGAVELARSFQPEHILFQGDAITFGYYGLKGDWAPTVCENAEQPSGNVNISVASPEMVDEILERLPGRTVLILSEKPDFDRCGLYSMLGKNGQRVNSFSVLVR